MAIMFSWNKITDRSFVLSCDVGVLAGMAEIHRGNGEGDDRWRCSVMGESLAGVWVDHRIAQIRAETWLMDRLTSMVHDLKVLQAQQEKELENERRANNVDVNAKGEQHATS